MTKQAQQELPDQASMINHLPASPFVFQPKVSLIHASWIVERVIPMFTTLDRLLQSMIGEVLPVLLVQRPAQSAAIKLLLASSEQARDLRTQRIGRKLQSALQLAHWEGAITLSLFVTFVILLAMFGIGITWLGQ